MSSPRVFAFLVVMLGALLLMTPDTAHAEGGCPEGSYPIGAPAGQQGPQGCAPIPGYQQAPSQRQPDSWEEHWISLAVDPATGVLGVDSDEVYAGTAELNAMIDCKDRGGVECRTWKTFKNTCAAVAGNSYYPLAINTDMEEAENEAMDACRAQADSACQVLYADCSRPVPVYRKSYR